MWMALVLLPVQFSVPLNALISLRVRQNEQGKNLELGNLEIVTSEFSGGKIFASSCGPKIAGLAPLSIKRSIDAYI